MKLRLTDENGNEILKLPGQIRPFARLVKQMRMKQVRYMQTRSDEALKEAQRMEKQIDTLISKVE